MKIVIKILILGVIFNNVHCGLKHPIDSCEIKEMKTLFSIPATNNNGETVGYSHYVLLKDFERSCMDSTLMINAALKYIDTVKIGNPSDIIMFFNSDKDFNLNQVSQDMEKINKSCLVIIDFNLEKRKPKEFLFYDNNGVRMYWGSQWKPKNK